MILRKFVCTATRQQALDQLNCVKLGLRGNAGSLPLSTEFPYFKLYLICLPQILHEIFSLAKTDASLHFILQPFFSTSRVHFLTVFSFITMFKLFGKQNFSHKKTAITLAVCAPLTCLLTLYYTCPTHTGCRFHKPNSKMVITSNCIGCVCIFLYSSAFYSSVKASVFASKQLTY